MSDTTDRFWDDHNKRGDSRRPHICDIPKEIFRSRHKHVLRLITEKGLPADLIGLFIAGKYYCEVWSSRACSNHLAKLIGKIDYLTFYSNRSAYFFEKNTENPVYRAFRKADELDNRM